MEKLAENDLTYFYLRHVVIVVTAVTTISLTPVIIAILWLQDKDYTIIIGKYKMFWVPFEACEKGLLKLAFSHVS
jgi:hypothetical protein